MKAYLVVCGSLFALLVIVHLVRVRAEPRLIHDPWFWLITIVAGVLSLWAWHLVWATRRG